MFIRRKHEAARRRDVLTERPFRKHAFERPEVFRVSELHQNPFRSLLAQHARKRHLQLDPADTARAGAR